MQSDEGFAEAAEMFGSLRVLVAPLNVNAESDKEEADAGFELMGRDGLPAGRGLPESLYRERRVSDGKKWLQ